MPDLPTPSVEMLWEPDDPHVVLRERFGFRDPASAGRWVAASVRDHWGVRTESCERLVMSDRNALAWVTTPSGPMLAKWSVAPERFARLEQIAHLVHWLDRRGLPVSAPIGSTDGRLQVEIDGVSMGLQRVVPGDLLDVGNPDQVRAAGAVLARLHLALAAYPRADQILPADGRPEPLAARITGSLRAGGDHVPQAARDTVRRLVADAPPGLPEMQILHGDFRSSNILCAGPSVAAVIDLEEVRLGHGIDEVARSAVMLGTRFRDWGPVSPRVRATFLAGYESVRPLTPAERGWWDVLVLWYAWALVPAGDDPMGWRSSALDQLADVAPG